MYIEFRNTVARFTIHAGSSVEARKGVRPIQPDSSTRQSAHRINERSAVRIGPRVPKFKFRWAEELQCNIGVYVRRWYIETPFGSIRIHHWLHSDDARAFHDHPWWFVTFVIAGGYIDKSNAGDIPMQAPKIAFRAASHAHTVSVNPGGCWTVLLTGPQVRKWGFWVGSKWKKANKYFFEHGVHVCD